MEGRVAFLGLWCLLACLIFSPLVEGGGSSSTRAPAARAHCPSDTLFYRQHCYQFVNSYVSWDDAELKCQQLRSGSQLASIPSTREGRLIAAYLRSRGVSSVWIGLEGTRIDQNMVWSWSDGSPVSVPLWDGYSLITSISSYECISMDNLQNSNSNKWKQRSCSDTLPYLCKYKASY